MSNIGPRSTPLDARAAELSPVRNRRLFVAAALTLTLLVGYLIAAGRAGAATAPLSSGRQQGVTVVDPSQPVISTVAVTNRAVARARAIAQARAAAKARAVARAKALAAARARAAARAAARARVAQVALDRREGAIANAVLSMLNAERRANGLPGLTMSAQLIRSAHGHNLTMARYNTMSHQLPGEAFFTIRIEQTGYRWWTAGENVGWNSDKGLRGARYLESLMYNEKAPNDGHRQNILNRSFRNVGIDIFIDARTGKLWLSQDFGSQR